MDHNFRLWLMVRVSKVVGSKYSNMVHRLFESSMVTRIDFTSQVRFDTMVERILSYHDDYILIQQSKNTSNIDQLPSNLQYMHCDMLQQNIDYFKGLLFSSLSAYIMPCRWYFRYVNGIEPVDTKYKMISVRVHRHRHNYLLKLLLQHDTLRYRLRTMQRILLGRFKQYGDLMLPWSVDLMDVEIGFGIYLYLTIFVFPLSFQEAMSLTHIRGQVGTDPPRIFIKDHALHVRYMFTDNPIAYKYSRYSMPEELYTLLDSYMTQRSGYLFGKLSLKTIAIYCNRIYPRLLDWLSLRGTRVVSFSSQRRILWAIYKIYDHATGPRLKHLDILKYMTLSGLSAATNDNHERNTVFDNFARYQIAYRELSTPP